MLVLFLRVVWKRIREEFGKFLSNSCYYSYVYRGLNDQKYNIKLSVDNEQSFKANTVCKL